MGIPEYEYFVEKFVHILYVWWLISAAIETTRNLYIAMVWYFESYCILSRLWL